MDTLNQVLNGKYCAKGCLILLAMADLLLVLFLPD